METMTTTKEKPRKIGDQDERRKRSFTVSAKKLLKAVKTIEHCISREETRYYLGGISIEFGHPEGVTMIATDGHRLAAYRIAEETQPRYWVRAIISRKAVKVLKSVLAKERADVALTVHSWNSWQQIDNRSQGWQHVTGAEITIANRSYALETIDGTFPDWQRVIPRSNEGVLVGNAPKWLYSLERHKAKAKELGVSAFSSVRIAGGKMFANFQIPVYDEKQRVITRGKNAGKTVSAKVLKDFTPTPWEGDAPATAHKVPEFGANARYLVDAIEAVKQGQRGAKCVFTIRTDDYGTSPLLFEGSDDALTYVLMPCRV